VNNYCSDSQLLMVVIYSRVHNYDNEFWVIDVDIKLFVVKCNDNTFITVFVPIFFFCLDNSVYFTYDL